ncbi:MAG: hypothetical protein ACP5HU_01905 [Phycisphaerae bacterium]
MNLLIVAVADEENVDDFLAALVDLDVNGLQVSDSSTVMEILAQDAPIFAGLRQLMSRPKAAGKLIFGVTDEDDILGRLDKLLRRLDIDLSEPGTGYALLVPLADTLGDLELGED